MVVGNKLLPFTLGSAPLNVMVFESWIEFILTSVNGLKTNALTVESATLVLILYDVVYVPRVTVVTTFVL